VIDAGCWYVRGKTGADNRGKRDFAANRTKGEKFQKSVALTNTSWCVNERKANSPRNAAENADKYADEGRKKTWWCVITRLQKKGLLGEWGWFELGGIMMARRKSGGLLIKPLSTNLAWCTEKFWPPLLEIFSYAEKKLSPNDKNRYKHTDKKIYNCTAACEFHLWASLPLIAKNPRPLCSVGRREFFTIIVHSRTPQIWEARDAVDTYDLY
jgi:hypothetical protein